jgi:hypothetical protein
MKKTFLRFVFVAVLTAVAFSSTPRDSSAAALPCPVCRAEPYDCMACCKCLGGDFWTCYWSCA